MTDQATLEEKFFLKKFYFSYSGLNKLLYSPSVWYRHYVLNEKEDKTDAYLIEGKVIHALLLDEANFSQNFIVSPMKFPGNDTKVFLERIFQHAKENECLHCELSEHTEKILELLKDINLHQSLKTDQQRIDKIVTEGNINYYEFIKTKEEKDVLDQMTFDRCKESAELLKTNERVSKLLRLGNKDKKVKVYNEYAIQLEELNNYPFGLRGILDNLVIDHKEKIVYINDIKTSGKTLSEFKETVDYYNYWLQAGVYRLLISKMIPEGYEVRFTFIVIDKYQQVYPFKVSNETLTEWVSKTKNILDIAAWHYNNRKFNLPYEFEAETVIL